MSKRGLSWDEKKTKMMEIFHENSEFLVLKELEKIAPKTKGIVLPSVKEVVEDLISEGKVTMEKIGTSNYYWSFPSATGALASLPPWFSIALRRVADPQKTAAVDRSTTELDSVNAKIDEVKSGISSAKKGREETPERRKLLETLEAENERSASLKAELAAFGAADPIKYEKKRQAVHLCKEAAQRWTDNTMILIQYTKSLQMMEQSVIYEMLGINEEWEDLPP